MSDIGWKIFRAVVIVAVVALPSTATIARPDTPAVVLGDITVNLAGNTKIGSVRSGMLCTPNGGLLWHQVAMPTDKAIRDAVVGKLESAGRAAVAGASRTLSVSVDGASIKVCTAWMGVGNAPKGKGSLTLTWREVGTSSAAERAVTMSQDLAFDHRDPRVEPAVIADAIAAAAVEYLETTDGAR